jgi:hypothetical protein
VVDGVTRAGTRWLLAALAALLTAWCLVPASLPVFDGVGRPDEPYRYVDPPPTAKTTKQPTTASGVVPVSNGKNGAQIINSGESGPQINIYVPPGALEVPAGATGVTVTATPLAPEEPLPTDGDIVTDVYRVTAQVDGKDVRIVGQDASAPAIQMRAPTAKQPGPVFERRTADGWEQLHTIRSGFDVYQTPRVSAFGEFALVELSPGAGGGGSGGVNVGLLVGGIAVLLIAGVIVAIRWRRTSSVAA